MVSILVALGRKFPHRLDRGALHDNQRVVKVVPIIVFEPQPLHHWVDGRPLKADWHPAHRGDAPPGANLAKNRQRLRIVWPHLDHVRDVVLQLKALGARLRFRDVGLVQRAGEG